MPLRAELEPQCLQCGRVGMEYMVAVVLPLDEVEIVQLAEDKPRSRAITAQQHWTELFLCPTCWAGIKDKAQRRKNKNKKEG
jgi:hypothetical protein